MQKNPGKTQREMEKERGDVKVLLEEVLRSSINVSKFWNASLYLKLIIDLLSRCPPTIQFYYHGIT